MQTNVKLRKNKVTQDVACMKMVLQHSFDLRNKWNNLIFFTDTFNIIWIYSLHIKNCCKGYTYLNHYSNRSVHFCQFVPLLCTVHYYIKKISRDSYLANACVWLKMCQVQCHVLGTLATLVRSSSTELQSIWPQLLLLHSHNIY